MPKSYRGPITRITITRRIAPHVQTRMTSQSAARRQTSFAAQNSKLEHFLGMEDYPAESSSDQDTVDSRSESELDNTADERVNVDDIADPARLRMYLKEALDIINRQGSSGSASETLKPLLDSRPDVVRHRSRGLSERIQQEHHTLAVKMHSGTDITPNNLNDILGKFLPEVQDIVQLSGPDALQYSYMVLTEIRETLFNLLNQLSNPAADLEKMECGTEIACDKMLADVYRKKMARGYLETGFCDSDLKIIKSQARLFSEAGLTDWFPESQLILEKIVNDSESE